MHAGSDVGRCAVGRACSGTSEATKDSAPARCTAQPSSVCAARAAAVQASEQTSSGAAKSAFSLSGLPPVASLQGQQGGERAQLAAPHARGHASGGGLHLCRVTARVGLVAKGLEVVQVLQAAEERRGVSCMHGHARQARTVAVPHTGGSGCGVHTNVMHDAEMAGRPCMHARMMRLGRPEPPYAGAQGRKERVHACMHARAQATQMGGAHGPMANMILAMQWQDQGRALPCMHARLLRCICGCTRFVCCIWAERSRPPARPRPHRVVPVLLRASGVDGAPHKPAAGQQAPRVSCTPSCEVQPRPRPRPVHAHPRANAPWLLPSQAEEDTLCNALRARSPSSRFPPCPHARGCVMLCAPPHVRGCRHGRMRALMDDAPGNTCTMAASSAPWGLYGFSIAAASLFQARCSICTGAGTHPAERRYVMGSSAKAA